MRLDKRLIYNFLIEEGITHLFHANTVGTACTFIKNGGLISRGAVEKQGLFQTYQFSDSYDKKVNVWNDIFLDNIDLHDYFRRYNLYGPVLFKININILLDPSTPDVYITKDNPIYWNKRGDISKNYFNNIEELKQTYRQGSYKEMITLKDSQSTLYFGDYLEEVILDNPKVVLIFEDSEDEIDLFESAKKILTRCVKDSTYNYENVNFKGRKTCPNSCYCHQNYLATETTELERLFLDISPSVEKLLQT